MAAEGALASPLLSSLWYRVAALRPKLRSHVALHRHRYRGEVWYLLRDPASGRVHRFTPSTRLLVALMDGRRTVAELWRIANRHLRDNAPTQDEVIHLLGQLHAADLLQSNVTPDVAELFERGAREERARQRRSFGNPMAVRIPLWDPDGFLDRARRPVGLIWSRWGALAWLVVVLPALLLAFSHWPDLSNDFTDRVLAVDNLAILYFVFPVLKVLHELGHASAAKSRGAEVHDLGMMLLVLLPIPYVDASAAATFKSKWDRALVGAAGVAVEAFVAALAFYAWLLIEPGLIRAVLFNVMVIAGVSTLIFNGNPLLRYDGYYILADLIEMPNLAARSLRYWSYLLERYFLGIGDAEAPDSSAGERAWFLFYGFASSLYRILVTVVIALFIAQRFFVIGVLLAAWAVAAMAFFPVVKGLRHLLASPRLRRRRGRSFAITALALALLGGFLLFVPMPYHSQAEGVMWLSEDALVRAGTNGFLTTILLPPGTKVKAGDALLRFSNLALATELQKSNAKVAEVRAEYAAELVSDLAKAAVARAKLAAARAELAAARQRANDLILRAKTSGEFVLPQAADLEGRYYHKGDLVAYVIGKTAPVARVVVPQAEVQNVVLGTRQVLVRPVDDLESVLEGRIVRAVPAGEESLPSRALGSEGGGEIATDPRERKGAKALQRMFQFDIALASATRGDILGQRLFVRFEYRKRPLLMQWYRRVRLLFLSTFDV